MELKKSSFEEYLAKRKSLLASIQAQKYGNMDISEDELAANEVFKKIVAETNHILPIEFHLNAVKYLKEVRASRLYKLLQKMPKGSHHHLHFDASPLPEYYVSLFRKYAENFFVNFEEQKFAHGTHPEPKDKWHSMKDVGTDRDEELIKFLNLEGSNPEDPWQKFNLAYGNRQVLTAIPKYCEEVLEKCCEIAIEEGFTNLQLKQVYPFYSPELNLEQDYGEKFLKQLQEKMRQKEPIFTIGLVYEGLRFFDEKTLRSSIQGSYEAKLRHKDLILAYDYVCEESIRETKEFAHVFIEVIDRQKEDNVYFPYVLHAGECVTGNNTNIVDSILFGNCPRIGHGINLAKHPQLYQTVKDKGICIELNPVSNHYLKYVNDLRMHPGISFFNYGIKVSINSDDPGLFRTDTIVDFFISAFSMEFDLLDLKRCILNSIECSLMGEEINNQILKDFENKWKSFIKLILNKEV